MNVSCLCPTFGRTRLLEESIESFLRQDYEGGQAELIVCNDLPEQTLSLAVPHPRIRIFNVRTRCANLGEKRNLTAASARYSTIMTWGDDDIHLPWRISDCVNALRAGAQYVREGRFFYSVKDDIRLLRRPPTGPFIMSADDYWNLGGIPAENCGEDRSFFDLVKKRLRLGETTSDFPAFIYRWGTGHYHISGLGDDKPGAKTGWERVGEHIQANIKKGAEPSGDVVLRPTWRKDYIEWARAALSVPDSEAPDLK